MVISAGNNGYLNKQKASKSTINPAIKMAGLNRVAVPATAKRNADLFGKYLKSSPVFIKLLRFTFLNVH
jgi:hypothetical protein